MKKVKKNKVFKMFLIIISFIVLINIVGHVVSITTDSSLILKIRPTNEVFIFAHGHYSCFKDIPQSFAEFCKTLPVGGTLLYNYTYKMKETTRMHRTKINGEYVPTYVLLDEMRAAGYEKIWISMCEQGNSEYVADFGNGTKIEWGDDVSRIKTPGNIYPIYWGLGVYRFNFGTVAIG